MCLCVRTTQTCPEFLMPGSQPAWRPTSRVMDLRSAGGSWLVVGAPRLIPWTRMRTGTVASGTGRGTCVSVDASLGVQPSAARAGAQVSPTPTVHRRDCGDRQLSTSSHEWRSHRPTRGCEGDSPDSSSRHDAASCRLAPSGLASPPAGSRNVVCQLEEKR